MKSVAILALAGLAAAQLQGLPTCAQSCANTFLENGIGNCGSDPKCICADSSFISDIACCLAKPGGCDAADQSSAVVFASQLCAANGVTVPTAVSCTSTSGAGTSTTATGTPNPASAGTTTDTATETGKTTTTTGGTTTTSSTGTAAAQTTSSSSTTSKNPAPRETAAFGAVVGGVVAALAML